MGLYKHKKLYEAFDLYCRQQCDELPTEEELADITFSAAFEEKMRKLLRRQKYGYYVLFGTAGRRVASIVVALLVSMTVATFSVKALREPFVRFITEVFETFTSILFVDDEPAPADAEMEAVVPAYIPAGYVVENEIKNDILHRVVYYNADADLRIYYIQSWEDKGSLGIDTETVEHYEVVINGNKGIVWENKNVLTIVFIQGEYSFSIAGSISQDELLRIAESIPLK